jgi:hypothetical protein
MRGKTTMNINFELLREQKEWLLGVTAPTAFRRFNHVSALRAKNQEMADGLLHLLDAIQDAAIEEGHTEEEVYGPAVEEWPRHTHDNSPR